MDRRIKFIISLLGISLMALGVACGTEAAISDDSAANGAEAAAPQESSNIEIADEHDDDHGIEDHETTVAAHADSDHEEIGDEVHEEAHTEADAHSHGEAAVDPDAPVTHLIANEFGYSLDEVEVEAGHPFTIMLHNEGMLEHDVAIEDHETMGGVHLIPGEDGMATFTLDEPGEYTFYCTVPGHHAAGMHGTLVVAADDHDADHEPSDAHTEDGHEDPA